MGKGDKENKDWIEITEMFMAQTDHKRCFYGIIKRGTEEYGNPFVFSRIVMSDGLIQAKADN
jgi:protein involved in ribonucleotide reduction